MTVPKHSRVRWLTAAAAFATAAFSFPPFFLLDRANIEGLVWIATSLGLVFFVRRRYSSAALLLALAASMKIFSGVLLLLFLAKKQYPLLPQMYLVYGVVVGVAFAVIYWVSIRRLPVLNQILALTVFHPVAICLIRLHTVAPVRTVRNSGAGARDGCRQWTPQACPKAGDVFLGALRGALHAAKLSGLPRGRLWRSGEDYCALRTHRCGDTHPAAQLSLQRNSFNSDVVVWT